MYMKLSMIKTSLLAALLVIPAVSQVGTKWKMGKNTRGFKALQLDQAKGHFHDAIPYGITMMDKLAADSGFSITHVTDATQFTQTNLARYDMIILNNCTQLPLILNTSQQAAFQWYVESFTGTDGKSQGGVYGWHGATDQSTSTWKWYTDWIVGEYSGGWMGMASYLPATNLPAGKGIAADDVMLQGVNIATWKYNDENYNWKINPYSVTTPGVTTVVYLRKDAANPVWSFSWRSTTKKARMFMTAIGHSAGILQDPNMDKHFAGALKWTAGPELIPDGISLTNDIAISASALNKSHGGFTVNITKAVPHSITVTSLAGRILAKESGNQSKLYDFSNRFPTGMYWVRIHTSVGNRVQKVSVL